MSAKRDQVFRAWSEPGLIREWMHPGGRQLSDVTMDFSPGGTFRIDLADPNGTLVHMGQFLEIKPPGKLAFMWQPVYGNAPPVRVDVSLEEVGDHTRVTVTHDPFGNEADEGVKPVSFNDIVTALSRFVSK